MNKLIKHYIIAIDGYSSSGKTTLAKNIAKYFHCIHIDSGAMYRAVTLFGIQNFFNPFQKKINLQKLLLCLSSIKLNFHFNKKNKIYDIELNGIMIGNEIRSFLVNELVSSIAKLKDVRNFLVQKQRELALQHSIVMEGRDIGTIVFPKADFKFFITASIEKRTKRRFLELSSDEVTKEDIKINLINRDLSDIGRDYAPLRQAKDALLIDTSNLSEIKTLQKVIDFINKKI